MSYEVHMTCTKSQKDIAPSEVPAIWIPDLLSIRSKIIYSCGVKAKPDDNLTFFSCGLISLCKWGEVPKVPTSGRREANN